MGPNCGFSFTSYGNLDTFPKSPSLHSFVYKTKTTLACFCVGCIIKSFVGKRGLCGDPKWHFLWKLFNKAHFCSNLHTWLRAKILPSSYPTNDYNSKPHLYFLHDTSRFPGKVPREHRQDHSYFTTCKHSWLVLCLEPLRYVFIQHLLKWFYIVGTKLDTKGARRIRKIKPFIWKQTF